MRLGEVRPVGRRPMPRADWARGVRIDGRGACSRDERPRPDAGSGRPQRTGRRAPPRPRGAGPPPRARPGRARPPELDPARQAALDLLTAVRVRDAYANLALPAILRRHGLRDRDAALATELGYGTLRAQGLLDAVIDACTERPLHRIEPPLLDALRLGAYQLLRTRIPPHAAVDTTVELVRAGAGSRSAGFVNAVLRRVGEQTEEAWVEQLAPDPTEDPVGHLALAHAHPRWIAQAFADALGARVDDELDAALAADDARPVVHLLARPGEITAEELALVTGGEPAPYSPYGVHLEPGGGDVGRPGRRARGPRGGAGRGQPARGAGAGPCAARRRRAPVARPVRRARRQGRAAGRARRASSGGTLDAVELAEHRAELVRRAVDGLPVTVHVADGRTAPLPDAAFDRVLVDAPCTGLGALRRRPEARWRRRPEDVAGLTRLQRELLGAALRLVRPGGVVAYVTCSPHLAETVGVVAAATGRRGSGGRR